MQTLEPAQEIVQIVDKNNIEIGQCTRAEMRCQKLIHRATYIFVQSSTGDLFIQKRTLTKDIYPGYWDVAAGGVVLAGESYDLSAHRELAEELGVVDCPLTDHGDHYYETDANKVWGRIYTCVHDGPFVLQKEEVEEGRFVAPHEIFQQQTIRFTPDGLEILARLIQKGVVGQQP